MAVTTDNQLGCDRDIDEVWEHADDPPTEHESHCLHCQAARRSLTDLNEATRHLKNRDIADHTLGVPQQFLAKAISVARAEVRRGSNIPMVRTESQAQATLTVSRQAIAAVVWHASDQLLPTIETRRCFVRSIDAEGDPGTPVNITLEVDVSVTFGVSIPQEIAKLRARLMVAVQEEIGVRASRIDVFVGDVHDA